ncbi:MAG: amino acid ABC transporter substrate-binding protein [Epsilonproteobacteria bacterium]|nr:amino acid ABC transporter substrate-binding protein [Campylobacterota bacterium]
MKQFNFIAFIIAITIAINAYSGTIVIGESEPLTGRLANHGIAVHEGIKYEIEEINAHGGINGSKIKLITLDDQGRSNIAIANARRLIQRGAVGIVGGYVDSVVGPIAEISDRAKVPYIASASLDKRLTELGYRYFFRVSNINGFTEPIRIFMSELGDVNTAILYPGTPGASQLAKELKLKLKKERIKIGLFERFRPGSYNFSSIMLKIRKRKINFIISLGFLPDNILFVRQLHTNKIKLIGFLGTFGIESHLFAKKLGKFSEGILGTTSWDQDITYPGTERFSNHYKITFEMIFGHQPDPLTMHGYAAAKVLIEAIKLVKDKHLRLSGDNIADQLRSIKLVLPLEVLSFSSTGEPKYYRRVIFQIINGKHVPLLRFPLKPLYEIRK